jgi:hypothetical protein
MDPEEIRVMFADIDKNKGCPITKDSNLNIVA